MNPAPHARSCRLPAEKGRSRARAIRCFGRIGLVSALAAMAGCFRNEPPADLTIINYSEPESLDPAVVTSQPDMRLVQGLFEGLTRLDPVTGGPIPGLAESWDVASNGCVYTFHLRTNLAWSTGDTLDAGDIVYTWIRALDPATASDYAAQLFVVKNAEAFNAGRVHAASEVGIRALDNHTVRIELDHPCAFFLDVCDMPVTSVVPRKAIEKYGDAWVRASPMPTSGPYELAFWRLNDKVRLRKNPRYWDAANTQSDLIDLLPVGTATGALNLYERGQVDVVWDKELVPAELLDILLRRPDFHTFHYLATYFFRFNVTRKPFDDARVRRALALAIDKDRIVRRLTRGGEPTASHLVPDGTAHYLPPAGLGHDPELARRLLAEAGFPGGTNFPPVQYLFNAPAGGSSRIHEMIAVEMQQMWHDELGIDINMRQLEMKVFLNEQTHLNYDLSRSSWVGDYNDPNTFLGLFTSHDGNNRTGWKNARYDELIEQANREPDLDSRAKLFQEAETILVQDEVPIVPLFFYVGINYFDANRIQGIYENILDQHPLQSIRKIGHPSKISTQPPAQSREPAP